MSSHSSDDDRLSPRLPIYKKSPVATRMLNRRSVRNWVTEAIDVTESGAFEEDQSVKSLDRGIRQMRATCRRQTDLSNIGY